MSNRWHVPRHLLAYLLIRLTALVLLIILIGTGQLTELVVLFMPVIAIGTHPDQHRPAPRTPPQLGSARPRRTRGRLVVGEQERSYRGGR